MTPRYDILLFDADNTLFDFSLAERNAFRETAERVGLPLTEELFRAYSEINAGLWKRLEEGGIGIEELKIERFRRLLLLTGRPDDGETLSEAAVLRDVYMEALSLQTCLVDGAEDVCRRLARDYALYIITNGISMIQRGRFGRSVLKPYFRGMFVSEEIGVQKPRREYFDAVFSALGNPPKERVLVIGDSLTSDCDGAIAYGLDICRFDPKNEGDGGRTLTYTVHTLSGIPDLLRERLP